MQTESPVANLRTLFVDFASCTEKAPNAGIDLFELFCRRPYLGADTRVREQIREFEVQAERTAQATAAYNPAPRPLPQQLHQSMRRDDADSVLSETTDRDVVRAVYTFSQLNRRPDLVCST